MEERTWAPGAFSPSADCVAVGGWPSALSWPCVCSELGAHPPVLCLRPCINKAPWPESLTLCELWEGWAVVQSQRNSPRDVPQDETSGTVSEGVPNLAAGGRAQKAELCL